MHHTIARATLSFTLIATALTVGLSTPEMTSAYLRPTVDQYATSPQLASSQISVPDVGATAGIVNIVAGDSHTCVLLDAGTVKCWGNNWAGQLGDGTNANRSTPVDVRNLNTVVAIAASYGTTCALESDGVVKCWGNNDQGQLGDGTITNRNYPARVSSLGGPAVAIAVGREHSCALLVSGTMRCWGWNAYAQLGTGSATPDRSLVPITATVITGNIIQMALGQSHTCVLLGTGGVKCWGSNSAGALGTGSSDPSPISSAQTPTGLSSGVVKLAAGYEFSCAVINTGALRCWGRNDTGQIGDNSTADKRIPTQVVGVTSGAIDVHGAVYNLCAAVLERAMCWGKNDTGYLGINSLISPILKPMTVVDMLNGVTQVAAGDRHNCALVHGGVMCWGDNNNGEVGDGTNTKRTRPAPVVGLEPPPFVGDCHAEGFDTVPPLGWSVKNNSEPAGTTDWFPGNTSYFTSQAGAPNSYAAANFNSTGYSGNISAWLVSPVMSLTNGSLVAIWTRKSAPDLYPDRLQVRLSQSGDSIDVGATSESFGDFTSLLFDLNPGLVTDEYPTAWNGLTLTLHGITGTVSGRVAFRYYVSNGGPGGINSDYIGIDSFTHCIPIDPLATPTPTTTETPTRTPTASQTPMATQTPTETLVPTGTPTQTPSQTPTNTPTVTPTDPPWDTPTSSPTPTATSPATAQPTSTPSSSPSSTPTATNSPTPSPTPTSLPTAAVGDRVWLDASANGKQDPGETGIGGVTVTLKMWNGVDDFVTLTTTRTGGTGLYLFEGLQAADYLLVFDHPAEYAFAAKHVAGATDATDSDVDPVTGESDFFTLAAGDNRRTFDAGLVPLSTATPTETPSETATPTRTPTATPSVTPTETPTPTATPTTGPAYFAFIPMALREP